MTEPATDELIEERERKGSPWEQRLIARIVAAEDENRVVRGQFQKVRADRDAEKVRADRDAEKARADEKHKAILEQREQLKERAKRIAELERHNQHLFEVTERQAQTVTDLELQVQAERDRNDKQREV